MIMKLNSVKSFLIYFFYVEENLKTKLVSVSTRVPCYFCLGFYVTKRRCGKRAKKLSLILLFRLETLLLEDKIIYIQYISDCLSCTFLSSL